MLLLCFSLLLWMRPFPRGFDPGLVARLKLIECDVLYCTVLYCTVVTGQSCPAMDGAIHSSIRVFEYDC